MRSDLYPKRPQAYFSSDLYRKCSTFKNTVINLNETFLLVILMKCTTNVMFIHSEGIGYV